MYHDTGGIMWRALGKTLPLASTLGWNWWVCLNSMTLCMLFNLCPRPIPNVVCCLWKDWELGDNEAMRCWFNVTLLMKYHNHYYSAHFSSARGCTWKSERSSCQSNSKLFLLMCTIIATRLWINGGGGIQCTWNLSIMDTIGTTCSVLIIEVALFPRFCILYTSLCS